METIQMDIMQAQIGSLATDVSRLEAKVSKGGGGGVLKIKCIVQGVTTIPIRAEGDYGNYISFDMWSSNGNHIGIIAGVAQQYTINGNWIAGTYTHYNDDLTTISKTDEELQEMSDSWYLIAGETYFKLRVDGTWNSVGNKDIAVDMNTGNVWIQE